MFDFFNRDLTARGYEHGIQDARDNKPKDYRKALKSPKTWVWGESSFNTYVNGYDTSYKNQLAKNNSMYCCNQNKKENKMESIYNSASTISEIHEDEHELAKEINEKKVTIEDKISKMDEIGRIADNIKALISQISEGGGLAAAGEARQNGLEKMIDGLGTFSESLSKEIDTEMNKIEDEKNNTEARKASELADYEIYNNIEQELEGNYDTKVSNISEHAKANKEKSKEMSTKLHEAANNLDEIGEKFKTKGDDTSKRVTKAMDEIAKTKEQVKQSVHDILALKGR